MEYKFCKPDAGLVLSEGHCISGYASVFGLRDTGGDTVQPGAYGASLQRLAARGDKVRMLWQHDPAQPIGIWEEVVEDARGLFVKGRLLPDVARAREALALVQAGALDGLSIGYRTVRAQALATGGRSLIELELWEVSLVTFPMQTQARISAKSGLMADLAMATARLREARAAVARL
ncbi:HK97 family phage prohead protease [Roseinatronobacter sp. NSM]|uniref:HK97 family phage prohead protease n=1 Tax=Roseinatronobacter sp. NSM TaxID=3457785 RepID=UPI0040363787